MSCARAQCGAEYGGRLVLYVIAETQSLQKRSPPSATPRRTPLRVPCPQEKLSSSEPATLCFLPHTLDDTVKHIIFF